MKRAWFILLLVPLLAGAWWGSTGFRRNSIGEIAPTDEAAIPGGFIPPDCPTSPDGSSLRFGSMCKNLTTGAVCMKDAAGWFNVRGGGPC